MSHAIAMQEEILRITLSGTVTPEDFQGVARDVTALVESLGYEPDRIVDLTGARDITVRFDTVSDLSRRRAVDRPRNRYRIVFVAATPAAFGIARMYQTLSEHADISVEMAATWEEALARLAG